MKKFFLINLISYLLISSLKLNVSMNYFKKIIPDEISNFINVKTFLNVINLLLQLTVFVSLYTILIIAIAAIFKFIFKDKVDMKFAKQYGNIYLLLTSLYSTIIFFAFYFLNGDVVDLYSGKTQVFVNIFSPVNIIFSIMVYKHILKNFKKDRKSILKFLGAFNLLIYINIIVVSLTLNNKLLG